MSKEVQRGVQAKLPVRILSSTDLPFSPAQPPVITRVVVNGADATDTVAATIAPQTNASGEVVTGHYTIAVATNTLQYNDQVEVYASATVEGVPLEVLKDFTVSSDASRMPKML